MTTWTQDYPAAPGSAEAAARHARTVAELHMPARAQDASEIVSAMFAVGVARSSAQTALNLVTEVDDDSRTVRFALHYAGDVHAPDPADSHQVLSRLADAYGERSGRGGRMVYAELRRELPPEELGLLVVEQRRPSEDRAATRRVSSPRSRS
ncbi:hypothetical protein ABZW11_26790 [Nonomuraea sp. NPDC004580]|uniref:hypothetical protein n=1 Tax=Nonomuraea sp. NPDC004580 TaxID=3154552 RepID=UPI0033BF6F35